MKYIDSLYTFAQAYDCNAYGAGNYGTEQVCTTEQTTNNNAGGLAPTGENIFIGVGSGLLLMVAAAAVMMRLRKKKAKAEDTSK